MTLGTSGDSPWEQLDDKGFVVVRGFLDRAHTDTLLEGFDRGSAPEDYPFGFKLIGRAALKVAWSRIEPLLAVIRARTRLKVDTTNFLTLSHYITTRFAERTSFLHQDFDLDYRLTKDHLNYLNFWMPLRKPDETKSNVTLIPFDALLASAPDEHRRLVGGGGNRFIVADGRTMVFGSYGRILDGGREMEPDRQIELDIEQLAVTPPLAVGDLLLMRGDVIHRTQDVDTDRVAASFRVTYSQKVITRDRARIDDGPASKGAANVDVLLQSCFDALGRAEITVEEFIAFSRRSSVPS